MYFYGRKLKLIRKIQIQITKSIRIPYFCLKFLRMTNGIIILDFGSKLNQLIARKIRNFGVYSEILPYHTPIQEVLKKQPKGIILSGQGSSVLSEDAALIERKLLDMDIPILGIGYGMHLIAHLMGAELEEIGSEDVKVEDFNVSVTSELFENIPETSSVWISDFDKIVSLPEGFISAGEISTHTAAIINETKRIYGVQFHPEVHGSDFGGHIIENFIFRICEADKNWDVETFIQTQTQRIREIVGDDKVILGMSGGVDSSVAAVLIHHAIGDNLHGIFVDTGLLRKDEGKKVMELYGEHFKMNLKLIDAKDQFLSKLKGVTDPEEKRKIIGHEFVEVFNLESKKFQDAKFLAQGTIYPDIIESQSVKNSAVAVKSHHNVGGLPEDMKLELLEPLKDLFKDDVRKVGIALGLPEEMVNRHPFPGPGLGIRILGEITEEKIRILQEADNIFIEELYKNDLYDSVSQAFVVLLPIKSVGITNDKRTYEYTAVLRSADSVDFMSATWSKLPYDFIDKVSKRIIKEVNGINRLVYDVTSKPPATIEWE